VTGPRPSGAPTRIALFASSFHPHKGGVEELVRQLAHAQAAVGLEPTIVTMRWPKSLPGHEVYEDLDVYRFVFRSPALPIGRLAAAIAFAPWTLLQLVLTLRRRRCQLIHIQCVSPASWYALQASRLLRLPLVVTMQGELTMDATGLYQRSRWARRTLRAVLRHADAITACSAHTLAEAQDWYRQPFGDRASVIHNAVTISDLERASPHREEKPYVFGIGRFVTQKGFDVLLDAFGRLADRPGFDHRLVLAGDGPERAALQDRARRLGIVDRVSFTGATDRSATASLFRGADLFVLASRHEPFGIVVLEALAAGTPVVASDVGGVSEFLPIGPLSQLVPAGDPAALADQMWSVITEHERHPDRSPAADEILESHSWPVIERAYADRYDDALTVG
jgi:glycogen(starch) synthase